MSFRQWRTASRVHGCWPASYVSACTLHRYLSFWIRQGDGRATNSSFPDSGDVQDNPAFPTYALRYGMTAVALLGFQVLRGTLFTQMSLRAASSLHNQVS